MPDDPIILHRRPFIVALVALTLWAFALGFLIGSGAFR